MHTRGKVSGYIEGQVHVDWESRIVGDLEMQFFEEPQVTETKVRRLRIVQLNVKGDKRDDIGKRLRYTHLRYPIINAKITYGRKTVHVKQRIDGH